MGQPKSKEIIIEAFGFTKREALKSLEALLLVRYQARLRKDAAGYKFVRGTNEQRFYIQHSLSEVEGTQVHCAYVRVMY